jgi:NADH-quinone oxidoreductase subunit M
MKRTIALELLVLLPLAGTLACLLVPKGRRGVARWTALGFSVAQVLMLVPLGMAGAFSGTRVEGVFSAEGSTLRLVADGLSTPLVALTVIVGVFAVAASWRVADRPRTHFALLMLLSAACTAVFLAGNAIAFYVAWEGVLVPMYFLIGGWGHERRRHAAAKFFIYTFAGSVFMLVGLIFAIGATGSTDLTVMAALRQQLPIPSFVFWLMLVGFLVKIPVVPLHTWLPDAHVEAPTAGSVVLAAVMLKMGGYGLLRVAMPIVPEGFEQGRALLAALGIAGIAYGAIMAFVQSDLKRLVAYSSVSHMGFVVLACALATPAALSAAMLVMISHGFVAGFLFFLVGALYDRTHTREIRRFGGLGKVVPLWGALFTFAALASLGLPGLSGFPGEFATTLEAYGRYGWWTLVLGAGLVFAAAYNLRAVRESVHGPVGEFTVLDDLDLREKLIAGHFAGAIVAVGVYPALVTRVCAGALGALAKIVGVS